MTEIETVGELRDFIDPFMEETRITPIDILLKALGTIADYDYSSDRDGICPYGCDTPFIARLALKKYAEETDAPDKEGL